MQNHDVPRFANSTDDLSLAMNVATFVLMSDGIPIIYQGQEQHLRGGTNPYTNREALWETGLDVFAQIYQLTATLNTLRQYVIGVSPAFTTTQGNVTYQQGDTMVLRKGANGAQIVTIFTSGGEDAASSDLQLSASEHGYAAGTGLTEVLSCVTYTVDTSGQLTVKMEGGLPMVLYPSAAISKSSLCNGAGVMYNEQNMTQTTTSATITATIDGHTTTTVVAATLPVYASQTFKDSTLATASAKSMALQTAVDSRSVFSAAAVVLALSSGIAGLILGS